MTEQSPAKEREQRSRRLDAPVDPALVALLNREMRAVGDTLREEVDRRLAGIERGLRSRGAGAAGPGAAASLWRRHRVDLYALVLAAGLGWALWQLYALRAAPDPTAAAQPPIAAGAAASPPPAPSASAPLSSPPQPAPTSVAPAITAATAVPVAELRLDIANPRDSWRAFVRDEPVLVATWLRAAAAGTGLASETVSAATAARLRGWADAVAAGTAAWDQSEIDASLLALFEYVARRQRAGVDTGRIDGVLDAGEYPVRLLEPALAGLGLSGRVAGPASTSYAGRKLQAAMVIAWLEAQKRSAGTP